MRIELLCLAAAGSMLGACSSFATELAEFDSVIRYRQGQEEPPLLDFRTRPVIRHWLVGGGSPLGWWGEMFGIDPVATEVENPHALAREKLILLAGWAEGNLEQTVHCAERFLLLAGLSDGPADRITALDALAQLAQGLGIDLLDGLLEPIGEVPPAAALAAARQVLGAGGGGAELTRAVELLTRVPLGSRGQRRMLLIDLAAAHSRSAEPAVLAMLEVGIRRALGAAVQHSLLANMQGIDPKSGVVRREAMGVLLRVAGPRAVPVILAAIEKPRERIARQEDRFDPDPYVRLHLVHVCGQLRRELAERRAPGRNGPGPSALEFLYDQVARVDNRLPGLQVAALEAMAQCLGRETVDFEPAWAHAFWEAYSQGREEGGR